VLRRAFLRTAKRPNTMIKTRLDLDKSADGVMRRAELCLKGMGLDRATYFYAWSIFSLEEFRRVMAPGGLYEGALRLKDQGLIKHICCSLHAPPEEMVEILKSGVFEAATISYSIINALRLEEVLQTAKENNIGLAVMNPLGGGVIPRNKEFFSFACNNEEKDTVQAALRFIQARPEIQVILSGVSSQDELAANLAAVEQRTSERDEDRVIRVAEKIRGLNNFCTGCRYCSDCPAGIPVSEIMQTRNHLLFASDDVADQSKASETLENINFLPRLEFEFSVLFDKPENPCIRCGKCERVCTQKLSIMDAVEDTYRRAKSSRFSVAARRAQMDELLNGHGYKKVGFYPGGNYTQAIINEYRDTFGEFPFEIEIFDSNPSVWGTMEAGFPVYGPAEISEEHPDCIVVTSHKYKEEIYKSICHHENRGIHVVKFHTDDDVPWLV